MFEVSIHILKVAIMLEFLRNHEIRTLIEFIHVPFRLNGNNCCGNNVSIQFV